MWNLGLGGEGLGLSPSEMPSALVSPTPPASGRKEILKVTMAKYNDQPLLKDARCESKILDGYNDTSPAWCGEQVRHILSELLMRGEVHDEVLTSSSVSVTEVRMSPDLRHATVFVKPLLGTDEADILKALQNQYRLVPEAGREPDQDEICREAEIPRGRKLRRSRAYREPAEQSEGCAGSGEPKVRSKPSIVTGCVSISRFTSETSSLTIHRAPWPSSISITAR